MRWIVGGRAVMKEAASTSQMVRFATEALTVSANLAALADLSGTWIDAVQAYRPTDVVMPDMTSSVSPTYGDQEGTACNGHFGGAEHAEMGQRVVAHVAVEGERITRRIEDRDRGDVQQQQEQERPGDRRGGGPPPATPDIWAARHGHANRFLTATVCAGRRQRHSARTRAIPPSRPS